jgi:hypothetical protein
VYASTEERPYPNIERKMAINKTRREVSGKAKNIDTLILDF